MKTITLFLLAISLTSCASKEVTKQQAAPVQRPNYKSVEIDVDKIKTLDDVIGMIKVMTPNEPQFNYLEDSVKDQKKLKAIKGLIKQKEEPKK